MQRNAPDNGAIEVRMRPVAAVFFMLTIMVMALLTATATLGSSPTPPSAKIAAL